MGMFWFQSSLVTGNFVADRKNICAVEKMDLFRNGQIISGFIISEMTHNPKLLCSLSCFRVHVEACRALMSTLGSQMNQNLGEGV